MLPRTSVGRTALALLALATAVNLYGELVDAEGVAAGSKWLLMPLLAAVLWAEAPARTRLVRLTLLALAFSWLGDNAPVFAGDDTGFLVMVGFFLVAQVVYIAAFWPTRHTSAARRPVLVLPYAAAIAALVALCYEGAGSLLVPVLVYGACLGTMAVLATGVHPVTGVGGALFLVSDSLIALTEFADGLSIPAAGFWVMLTYVVAQALIILGVLARERQAAAGQLRATPPGSGRWGMAPSA